LSNERAFAHSFAPGCLTANAIYRKDVLERVGLFENEWPSGGDMDLSWRMQIDGGWRLVYEPSARVFHRHRATWALPLKLNALTGARHSFVCRTRMCRIRYRRAAIHAWQMPSA
jgi:cellulose synthase/poly-beta-1,6-N-acetylglucosamine synthase-like glycosyltransferase